MSPSAPASCAVHVHGLDLVCDGPNEVVAAVMERLGHLPASTAAGHDRLHFKFSIAENPTAHGCARPLGEGRPFYQPDAGEALYWPGDDVCYLELQTQARALCHPAQGRCVVSLLEPAHNKLWLAAHPLLTLPLLEMLKRRHLFFVHAASFAVDGRSLLLPGSSGSGKSTLSIALLRAGFAYMGDDLAFLDGEQAHRVLAFPESISATEQTLAFFPEAGAWRQAERPPGWPKYEIPPAAISPVPVCSQAVPAALVFPEIAHAKVSVLSPMSGDEALTRLAANLLLTERRSTQAHLAALAALARSTPAFRLRTGTDLTEATGRLRELLP